jgi:hypothetical protein
MRNIQAFETIVHQSRRILLMDAFISDRTISLLQHLAIPFYLEYYKQPQLKRTCQKIDAADAFLALLLADLKAGKHIFLFCTSHKQLTESILPCLRQGCRI